MRFGATYNITKDSKNPVLKVAITKYRDYDEYVNETIHEERKQIIKIQDFDTLVSKLHIDHALSDHVAWIEYKDGKMYAVLTWITKG